MAGLRLYLFRHAKSAWDDPALEDYDRPLAPRGRDAARSMGAWMRRHDAAPDLVLCSTAARAQQTALLCFEERGWPAAVRYERALYLAPAEALVARVAAIADGERRVMLIGHNPGLEDAASRLSVEGEIKMRHRLKEKYPTAALVILDFAHEDWAQAMDAGGRLVEFITPHDL